MVQYTEEQRREWLASLEKRVSAAGVIIEDEQGRVLAVKANYKSYWSLPGGVIDAGETPLRAAVREVKEEIGLMLDEEQLDLLVTACRQSEDVTLYQFVFVVRVRDLSIEALALQASEIDEARLFTKDEILSGEQPMAWAFRAWADGVRGYCETRLCGADGANEQIITWRKQWEY